MIDLGNYNFGNLNINNITPKESLTDAHVSGVFK